VTHGCNGAWFQVSPPGGTPERLVQACQRRIQILLVFQLDKAPLRALALFRAASQLVSDSVGVFERALIREPHANAGPAKQADFGRWLTAFPRRAGPASRPVEGNQAAAVVDGLAEHVGFGRVELALGVQNEEEFCHAVSACGVMKTEAGNLR
jgi:hypothetical protein